MKILKSSSQGFQQLCPATGSVTQVVISYDWHPHEHCSFVESANDGKVELKEKETPRINLGDVYGSTQTCHCNTVASMLVGLGDRQEQTHCSKGQVDAKECWHTQSLYAGQCINLLQVVFDAGQGDSNNLCSMRGDPAG